MFWMTEPFNPQDVETRSRGRTKVLTLVGIGPAIISVPGVIRPPGCQRWSQAGPWPSKRRYRAQAAFGGSGTRDSPFGRGPARWGDQAEAPHGNQYILASRRASPMTPVTSGCENEATSE
jgi:hypothetical protein